MPSVELGRLETYHIGRDNEKNSIVLNHSFISECLELSQIVAHLIMAHKVHDIAQSGD